MFSRRKLPSSRSILRTSGAVSTDLRPRFPAPPGRQGLVKSPVMPQASHVPDERLDATLDMLERLFGFDTESAKSNLGLVAFVEDYLNSLGVAYVKIPNAAGDKAALFASIGPNRDGGIVLSGHTDVVPVAGQAWTRDRSEER